jgi:hypothetical protein
LSHNSPFLSLSGLGVLGHQGSLKEKATTLTAAEIAQTTLSIDFSKYGINKGLLRIKDREIEHTLNFRIQRRLEALNKFARGIRRKHPSISVGMKKKILEKYNFEGSNIYHSLHHIAPYSELVKWLGKGMIEPRKPNDGHIEEYNKLLGERYEHLKRIVICAIGKNDEFDSSDLYRFFSYRRAYRGIKPLSKKTCIYKIIGQDLESPEQIIGMHFGDAIKNKKHPEVREQLQMTRRLSRRRNTVVIGHESRWGAFANCFLFKKSNLILGPSPRDRDDDPKNINGISQPEHVKVNHNRPTSATRLASMILGTSGVSVVEVCTQKFKKEARAATFETQVMYALTPQLWSPEAENKYRLRMVKDALIAVLSKELKFDRLPADEELSLEVVQANLKDLNAKKAVHVICKDDRALLVECVTKARRLVA